MSTLVNASSMQAFPVASQVFSSLRASKSKPSMPPTSKSQKPSELLGMLAIGASFIAAFVINVTVLFGILSFLAPKLPLACLGIYGSGYALLLVIVKLEAKAEETWTLAMRKEQAPQPHIDLDEEF